MRGGRLFFKEVWYHNLESNIRTIQVNSLCRGDGKVPKEIFVGLSNGIIYFIGADGSVRDWRKICDDPIKEICVTDIDNDGSNEIVVLGRSPALTVLDSDKKICWDAHIIPNDFVMAIGDVDKDGCKEIFVTDTFNNIIIGHKHDGDIFTDVTYKKSNVLYFIDDFDNDGALEGMIYDERGIVKIVDMNTLKEKKKIKVGDMDSIGYADIDGDGKAEIIISEPEDYVIKVYKLDGKRLWKAHFYDTYFFWEAEDVDGDGRDEIIVYVYDRSPDKISILDHFGSEKAWYYPLADVQRISFFDITGDGRKEIFALGDGIIQIIDYRGVPLFTVQIDKGKGPEYYKMLVSDIDDDKIVELIVGDNRGLLRVFKISISC